MSLVRFTVVMSVSMMLAGLWARNAVADDGAARDRKGDQVRSPGGPPLAADRDLFNNDFHDLYAGGPPRDPGTPDDQSGPQRPERTRDAGQPPRDDHQAAPPNRPGSPDSGPPQPPRDDSHKAAPPNGKGLPAAGQPPRDKQRQPSPPKGKVGPGTNRSRKAGTPPRESLESLLAKDPEMAQLTKAEADLDRQSYQKAMEYRQASSVERDKIKLQLEQLVNKQFEVRQQRRAHELKWLEGELQRLRGAIDRRTKARKAIVDKRVSDLLGLEDDVGF